MIGRWIAGSVGRRGRRERRRRAQLNFVGKEGGRSEGGVRDQLSFLFNLSQKGGGRSEGVP